MKKKEYSDFPLYFRLGYSAEKQKIYHQILTGNKHSEAEKVNTFESVEIGSVNLKKMNKPSSSFGYLILTNFSNYNINEDEIREKRINSLLDEFKNKLVNEVEYKR